MNDRRKRHEARSIEEQQQLYEERGREMTFKEVATEMLRAGMDSDMITKVTHLNNDDIESLKEQL